jgi:hypothetical protein
VACTWPDPAAAVPRMEVAIGNGTDLPVVPERAWGSRERPRPTATPGHFCRLEELRSCASSLRSSHAGGLVHAAAVSASVGPPFQWGNQLIADLHPELRSMVLTGPQRPHPAFRIDPCGVVHPGQRPVTSVPRTGPADGGHVLLRPLRLKCHSAPPNLVQERKYSGLRLFVPAPTWSQSVHPPLTPN